MLILLVALITEAKIDTDADTDTDTDAVIPRFFVKKPTDTNRILNCQYSNSTRCDNSQ